MAVFETKSIPRRYVAPNVLLKYGDDLVSTGEKNNKLRVELPNGLR